MQTVETHAAPLHVTADDLALFLWSSQVSSVPPSHCSDVSYHCATLLREITANQGTKEVRVLVLNFDPVVNAESGRRLQEECRWNDAHKLAAEHAGDVREASGGRVSFKFVEWSYLDEFPVKVDGFSYTLPQFLETWGPKKFPLAGPGRLSQAHREARNC
jgi:hypothetical protein